MKKENNKIEITVFEMGKKIKGGKQCIK